MEKFTQIFKKPVDLIIIAGVITALFVGFITYKNFRQTASNQIEATSKIMFEVFLRSVTLTSDEIPIKANEKTFISIRNVPYSNLDVLNVKSERKKTILQSINNKITVIDDASQADMYDIIVTLTDTAKIIKDGAVVGGNKIKIGLPITLEGVDYKLNGIVSDLKVMSETDDNQFHNSIHLNTDIQ